MEVGEGESIPPLQVAGVVFEEEEEENRPIVAEVEGDYGDEGDEERGLEGPFVGAHTPVSGTLRRRWQ